MGFTWKGPDQFASLMNDPENLTHVLVTFYGEIAKTRVVVEHTGWGDDEEWEKAIVWHQRAWEEVLESLKLNLESKKI